eukprot:GHVR01178262.1.p1 GENE.GHVR01178262.1~~GHVR01178262.1.p1  ORF type:complete len:227 (+),score=24.74 GHVR01178262.1:253-933(+)
MRDYCLNSEQLRQDGNIFYYKHAVATTDTTNRLKSLNKPCKVIFKDNSYALGFESTCPYGHFNLNENDQSQFSSTLLLASVTDGIYTHPYIEVYMKILKLIVVLLSLLFILSIQGIWLPLIGCARKLPLYSTSPYFVGLLFLTLITHYIYLAYQYSVLVLCVYGCVLNLFTLLALITSLSPGTPLMGSCCFIFLGCSSSFIARQLKMFSFDACLDGNSSVGQYMWG